MKYLLLTLFMMPVFAMAQQPDTSRYASLLNNYLHGNKDYKVMPSLFDYAKGHGQIRLADSIGQDYSNHYLSKLDEKNFLTKENLEAFFNFNKTSKNRGFKIFFKNRTSIDQIVGQQGFADMYIRVIIYWDNIRDKIWQEDGKIPYDDPDWNGIQKTITKKYNKDFAEWTVLDAQYGIAKFKKDSAAMLKYGVQKYTKYGFDTTDIIARYDVNNFCWSFIFEHCCDAKTLEKAASWVNICIRNEPYESTKGNFMDTYACLLFKLNFIFKDAETDFLQIEKRAVAFRPKDFSAKKDYDAMQKGIPCWSTVNY